jgi:O-antigen/teichoic acid export membrane protein
LFFLQAWNFYAMRPQMTHPQSAGLEPGDAAAEAIPARVKRAGIIARLLHGTGAGAVAYGLGIGSNLLLLPLYLRFWSVAVYGEWMTLYSIVNYLGSLDFGVTAAAINAATIVYARDDWAEFKKIQGTAWASALVIAGIGGLLVSSLSLFYFHVDRWLGLTSLGHSDARIVFCCLALSLLASIPGRQLIGVYIATGGFAKYQWLYNAFTFFSLITTAVALLLGARPVTLAEVTAGATLTTIAFSLWLLHRNGSKLYPRIQDSDWRIVRSLAAPSGQFGISIIATALTVQGPIVILSRALGGPAVALFTTTRTVANVVKGTLTLLRAPLTPEFGAAAAKPSFDAVRRLFRIAVGIDATIAICLTAILWSGGVWVIRFWSHSHIEPDPRLLHLLLIAFVLESFLQMLAFAGWSTNRFQAWSLGQLATATISLVVAASLVSRFGPSAIPLGALIPLMAIMTPLSVQNARSEGHLSLSFIVTRMLIPFATLIVFSAALPSFLASLSIGPEWLHGIVSSVAICAAAGFTGAAVFLTRDDRQAVRDRICG